MPPSDSNIIQMPLDPAPVEDASDDSILTGPALDHFMGANERTPEILARALVIYRLLEAEAPRIRREVQQKYCIPGKDRCNRRNRRSCRSGSSGC